MGTTIHVSDEVWQYLNGEKRPGESFDDVLRRELGLTHAATDAGDKANVTIESASDARQTSGESGHDAEVAADGLDLPAGVDEQEAHAAIEAAAAHIDEREGASMREIVTAVMPDHPLGYDVPDLESGDRYRGAWWRRVVKPGLERRDDVAKPQPGQSEWRSV